MSGKPDLRVGRVAAIAFPPGAAHRLLVACSALDVRVELAKADAAEIKGLRRMDPHLVLTSSAAPRHTIALQVRSDMRLRYGRMRSIDGDLEPSGWTTTIATQLEHVLTQDARVIASLPGELDVERVVDVSAIGPFRLMRMVAELSTMFRLRPEFGGARYEVIVARNAVLFDRSALGLGSLPLLAAGMRTKVHVTRVSAVPPKWIRLPLDELLEPRRTSALGTSWL